VPMCPQVLLKGLQCGCPAEYWRGCRGLGLQFGGDAAMVAAVRCTIRWVRRCAVLGADSRLQSSSDAGARQHSLRDLGGWTLPQHAWLLLLDNPPHPRL
jgi:hypothetical protein